MLSTDKLMTVDQTDRELLRELHFQTRKSMKSLIHAALTEYAENHGFSA